MQFGIVYNGFWNPDSPPAPVQAVCDAAAARGWHATPLPHTALTVVCSGGIQVLGWPSDWPLALFWDKDVRLAHALEQIGVRVYNSAAAIAVCDDKAATHTRLAEAGIPMPATLIAPMTYRSFTPDKIALLRDRAAAALGWPMVVKECYGSLGGQVHLARDSAAWDALVASFEARPFLCQHYEDAFVGTDWRLYVVGGRVVAAMCRHHPSDFRANVAGGGHGAAYAPTPDETALALRCCDLLGLDFGAVDLLRDRDGRPLVCEVNSNAFLAEISACTGVSVADAIVCHCVRAAGMA